MERGKKGSNFTEEKQDKHYPSQVIKVKRDDVLIVCPLDRM